MNESGQSNNRSALIEPFTFAKSFKALLNSKQIVFILLILTLQTNITSQLATYDQQMPFPKIIGDRGNRIPTEHETWAYWMEFHASTGYLVTGGKSNVNSLELENYQAIATESFIIAFKQKNAQNTDLEYQWGKVLRDMNKKSSCGSISPDADKIAVKLDNWWPIIIILNMNDGSFFKAFSISDSSFGTDYSCILLGSKAGYSWFKDASQKWILFKFSADTQVVEKLKWTKMTTFVYQEGNCLSFGENEDSLFYGETFYYAGYLKNLVTKINSANGNDIYKIKESQTTGSQLTLIKTATLSPQLSLTIACSKNRTARFNILRIQQSNQSKDPIFDMFSYYKIVRKLYLLYMFVRTKIQTHFATILTQYRRTKSIFQFPIITKPIKILKSKWLM